MTCTYSAFAPAGIVAWMVLVLMNWKTVHLTPPTITPSPECGGRPDGMKLEPMIVMVWPSTLVDSRAGAMLDITGAG